MQILVDADACPKVIRDILFKAAERVKIPTFFIANQKVPTPPSQVIKSIQVPKGFDVADHEIVRRTTPNDLVITQDIPLAAEVMELGAAALHPRGDMYNKETIRQKLNMRDFMDTLRSSGVHTGGPSTMGSQEKQQFANQLDRWITRNWKGANHS